MYLQYGLMCMGSENRSLVNKVCKYMTENGSPEGEVSGKSNSTLHAKQLPRVLRDRAFNMPVITGCWPASKVGPAKTEWTIPRPEQNRLGTVENNGDAVFELCPTEHSAYEQKKGANCDHFEHLPIFAPELLLTEIVQGNLLRHRLEYDDDTDRKSQNGSRNTE